MKNEKTALDRWYNNEEDVADLLIEMADKKEFDQQFLFEVRGEHDLPVVYEDHGENMRWECQVTEVWKAKDRYIAVTYSEPLTEMGEIYPESFEGEEVFKSVETITVTRWRNSSNAMV